MLLDGSCTNINGNLCNMGIPMGLQYSITAIGSVILQTAVNGLGSTAVASVTAAGKISMFCCCPFDALGSTMATYAGQNVGAKMDRVNTGILTSSIIGSVYSVVILGVMFLWSRQISLLFVDASETVITRPGASDAADQHGILHSADPCQCRTLYRAGHGLQQICNPCRRLRDDRPFGGSLFPGSVFWLHRSLLRRSPVAWILADLFLVPAYLYCAKTLRSLFEKNEMMAVLLKMDKLFQFWYNGAWILGKLKKNPIEGRYPMKQSVL